MVVNKYFIILIFYVVYSFIDFYFYKWVVLFLEFILFKLGKIFKIIFWECWRVEWGGVIVNLEIIIYILFKGIGKDKLNYLLYL